MRLIRILSGVAAGGNADPNPFDRILWGSLSISKLHSVASRFGRREEPMPFGGVSPGESGRLDRGLFGRGVCELLPQTANRPKIAIWALIGLLRLWVCVLTLVIPDGEERPSGRD